MAKPRPTVPEELFRGPPETRYAYLVCEERKPESDGEARRLLSLRNTECAGTVTEHRYLRTEAREKGSDLMFVHIYACEECDHERVWGAESLWLHRNELS